MKTLLNHGGPVVSKTNTAVDLVEVEVKVRMPESTYVKLLQDATAANQTLSQLVSDRLKQDPQITSLVNLCEQRLGKRIRHEDIKTRTIIEGKVSEWAIQRNIGTYGHPNSPTAFLGIEGIYIMYPLAETMPL